MRLQTAPTGPGEDIELPIYFLKLHLACGTRVRCSIGDLWFPVPNIFQSAKSVTTEVYLEGLFWSRF